MKLSGLQRLTLLDYPEKTACTVFTQGCNFRCPFCHNSGLIGAEDGAESVSEEELFAFLDKRRRLLDGVCISGGEPTLQPDLEEFCKRIKSMGFLVKLDTNGSDPDKIQGLTEQGLVDYIAMDVKNSLELYPKTCGLDLMNIGNISKSIKYLMEGRIPYEFRTTLVREYHDMQSLESLAEEIAGAERYFLQSFVDSPRVRVGGLHSFSAEELNDIAEVIRRTVPSVRLRGV